MATSVTWWALSQSCSVSRPRTVVANSATSCVRPPVSAGMRTQAVTCALCTSSAAARSTITSTVLLLSGAPQNNGVARQESPKQTSLMSVLKWPQSRDPGGGSHAKLTAGSQAPKTTRRRRTTPAIIAHFHPPRVAKAARETYTERGSLHLRSYADRIILVRHSVRGGYSVPR